MTGHVSHKKGGKFWLPVLEGQTNNLIFRWILGTSIAFTIVAWGVQILGFLSYFYSYFQGLLFINSLIIQWILTTSSIIFLNLPDNFALWKLKKIQWTLLVSSEDYIKIFFLPEKLIHRKFKSKTKFQADNKKKLSNKKYYWQFLLLGRNYIYSII